MKRLLVSMAVMFAFTLTSQAQWGPGGDNGLGGGDGEPVKPDLIILSTTAPSTWSNITGTTFQVTVRNNHNAASAAASQVQVKYKLNQNNYPYYAVHSLFFNVPAFAVGEIDKTITATVGPVPVHIYGSTTTLISIMADSFYQVAEANETNNSYTP